MRGRRRHVHAALPGVGRRRDDPVRGREARQAAGVRAEAHGHRHGVARDPRAGLRRHRHHARQRVPGS